MSTVEEYVYAYVLVTIKELGLSEAFLKRHETLNELHGRIDGAIGDIDTHFYVDIQNISAQLFDELLSHGAFEVENDEIVGTYYKYAPHMYPSFRKNFINNSRIVQMHQRIGERYFREIFERFAELEEEEEAEGPQVSAKSTETVQATDAIEAELIPASDRMVPLNHNAPEYEEIRAGINDAIQQVAELKTNRLSPDEQASAVATLKSAASLWEAFELKAVHVKVGIIMALEDVQAAIGETFRLVAGGLLVDAIKALIKAWTGFDF